MLNVPGPGRSAAFPFRPPLLLVPMRDTGDECLIEAKSGLYWPGPGFSLPPGLAL